MITTPIKKIAAAGEKFVEPARTVANELPQELSKLPGHDEFRNVNSSPQRSRPTAQRGRREKAGRRKKPATLPKTRKRAVITLPGFMDDGHPTILAAARSNWIPPS